MSNAIATEILREADDLIIGKGPPKSRFLRTDHPTPVISQDGCLLKPCPDNEVTMLNLSTHLTNTLGVVL